MNLQNISGLQTRSPCTQVAIQQLASVMQLELPKDYQRLLEQTNGFDADDIRLYPIEEMVERNATYEVHRYCPGYLAIGDDGAGNAILVKHTVNDPRIYMVGHGVMMPNFMVIVGENLCHWLAMGCPGEE